MHIIWDSKANNDLNNNIGYIAKQSPQNALMVLNSLLELPNILKTFPFAYPKEPHYNNENIRYITLNTQEYSTTKPNCTSLLAMLKKTYSS